MLSDSSNAQKKTLTQLDKNSDKFSKIFILMFFKSKAKKMYFSKYKVKTGLDFARQLNTLNDKNDTSRHN